MVGCQFAFITVSSGHKVVNVRAAGQVMFNCEAVRDESRAAGRCRPGGIVHSALVVVHMTAMDEIVEIAERLLAGFHFYELDLTAFEPRPEQFGVKTAEISAPEAS